MNSSSQTEVLILGGTTEARRLAASLTAAGVRTLTSLAGVTAAPPALAGAVRTGGFGGVTGLTAFLTERRFAAVIDATHAFASRMPFHAAAACQATDIPLLRLLRPGWREHPAAASWHWVDSLAAAKAVAEPAAGTVFLSIGRQELGTFADWTDRAVLARTIEPPLSPVPTTWTVVRARGPFTLEAERRLFGEHEVALLLTKDSGGPAAKLDVAGERRVPVVIIQRPAQPTGVPRSAEVETALGWVLARTCP